MASTRDSESPPKSKQLLSCWDTLSTKFRQNSSLTFWVIQLAVSRQRDKRTDPVTWLLSLAGVIIEYCERKESTTHAKFDCVNENTAWKRELSLHICGLCRIILIRRDTCHMKVFLWTCLINDEFLRISSLHAFWWMSQYTRELAS